MTRRARMPWLSILALATLVAGCSSTPTIGPASPAGSAANAATANPPSPATGEASAWQQVLEQILPDGTVTAETALQAFSLAFGPLPDVTVPAGPVGEIRSGSGAVRWLVGHWAEITVAQRAEAVRLVPELAGVTGEASTTPIAQPGFQLVTYTGGAPAPVQPPTYYAVLAQTMADEIEAHTGLPMLLTLFAAEGRTQQKGSLADTGVYAEDGGTTGTASKCVITVSAKGAAESPADLEDTIGHEVWHCYQGQIRGLDWYYAVPTPSWLIEGQAEWVGDALRPTATADTPWNGYIQKPEKALFARSYDALGFYAHLTQSQINTWDVLIPMLKSADDNPARYEASGATSDAFLDTWASGFFREPGAGAAWEFEGPGLPTTQGPARQPLDVGNGTSTPFSAPAYANTVFDVSSSADIVSFTVDGHARLADPGNGQEYVLAGGSFCTKAGGCICPPGMTFAGVPPSGLSARTFLAVTGGPDGTRGVATGHPLEEFCKKDDEDSTWSMVFWSPDLGESAPPLLAAYTCDGLESTWKAVFLPGPSPLQQTFELPFGSDPAVHHDFHYDVPADQQSNAQTLDYAIDFVLDTTADPPVIRVSGTKTESEGGQSRVLQPREFGSDAPLVLRNVSLEAQLKGHPEYQHPFRTQALQECGA